MSLLLRRRAALEAAALDENDGKYCYAVGISSSYSNAIPWIYKSYDYGATWHTGLPMGTASRFWISQSAGRYFSRLGVNNEVVCVISGSCIRYHKHEDEIDGIYQYNSGSLHTLGSGLSDRTNLCISSGNYVTESVRTDPAELDFPSTTFCTSYRVTSSKSAVVHWHVDPSWTTGSNYYRFSTSASAISRDGQFMVIGGGLDGGVGRCSAYSTDGGHTWHNITFDSSSQVSVEYQANDACMSADGKVTMIATRRGIIVSDDYMNTWYYKGTTNIVSCCIRADGKRAWISNYDTQTLREIDLSNGYAGWISWDMSETVLSKIRCNGAGNKFIGILSSSDGYTGSFNGYKGRQLVYSHMESPSTWTTASTFGATGLGPYYMYVHDIAMSYTV